MKIRRTRLAGILTVGALALSSVGAVAEIEAAEFEERWAEIVSLEDGSQGIMIPISQSGDGPPVSSTMDKELYDSLPEDSRRYLDNARVGDEEGIVLIIPSDPVETSQQSRAEDAPPSVDDYCGHVPDDSTAAIPGVPPPSIAILTMIRDLCEQAQHAKVDGAPSARQLVETGEDAGRLLFGLASTCNDPLNCDWMWTQQVVSFATRCNYNPIPSPCEAGYASESATDLISHRGSRRANVSQDLNLMHTTSMGHSFLTKTEALSPYPACGTRSDGRSWCAWWKRATNARPVFVPHLEIRPTILPDVLVNVLMTFEARAHATVRDAWGTNNNFCLFVSERMPDRNRVTGSCR